MRRGRFRGTGAGHRPHNATKQQTAKNPNPGAFHERSVWVFSVVGNAPFGKEPNKKKWPQKNIKKNFSTAGVLTVIFMRIDSFSLFFYIRNTGAGERYCCSGSASGLFGIPEPGSASRPSHSAFAEIQSKGTLFYTFAKAKSHFESFLFKTVFLLPNRLIWIARCWQPDKKQKTVYFK